MTTSFGTVEWEEAAQGVSRLCGLCGLPWLRRGWGGWGTIIDEQVPICNRCSGSRTPQSTPAVRYLRAWVCGGKIYARDYDHWRDVFLKTIDHWGENP